MRLDLVYPSSLLSTSRDAFANCNAVGCSQSQRRQQTSRDMRSARTEKSPPVVLENSPQILECRDPWAVVPLAASRLHRARFISPQVLSSNLSFYHCFGSPTTGPAPIIPRKTQLLSLFWLTN